MSLNQRSLTSTNKYLCLVKLGSYVNAHLHLCLAVKQVVLEFGFRFSGAPKIVKV